MSNLLSNKTLVHDLLNLGILTMCMADDKNSKIIRVVDSILSTKPVNTTLLKSVQAGMKREGFDMEPLGPLLLLQSLLKEEVAKERTFTLPWVHAFVIIFVEGMFVAMRLAVKKFIVWKVKRDGWLIFVAWLSALAYGVMIYYDEVYAFGCNHIWNHSVNSFEDSLRMLFILELSYVIVSWIIKACIIGFYWDLVPFGEPRFRFFHVSTVIGFIIVTATHIAGLFTVIFQCKPVNYWSDPLNAKCLPRVPVWVGMGGLVIFTDLIVLLLPIRVVWIPNLQRREKIVVTALFCLGSLSCILNFPRIYRTVLFLSDPDITFKRCSTTLWVNLEFSLAIIAVCIPSAKYVVLRYLPLLLPQSMMSHTSRSGSRDYSGCGRGMRSRTLTTVPSNQSYRVGEVRERRIEMEEIGRDAEGSDDGKMGSQIKLARVRSQEIHVGSGMKMGYEGRNDDVLILLRYCQ